MLAAGAARSWRGWMLASAAAAMLVDLLAGSRADREIARTRPQSERDERRPPGPAGQRRRPHVSATTGSLDETAQMVERRHAALALLLIDMFNGVARRRRGPAPGHRPLDPGQQLARPAHRSPCGMDQERLIDARRDLRQQPRRAPAPGLPAGRPEPLRLSPAAAGPGRAADRGQGSPRPGRRAGRGRGLRRAHPAAPPTICPTCAAWPTPPSACPSAARRMRRRTSWASASASTPSTAVPPSIRAWTSPAPTDTPIYATGAGRGLLRRRALGYGNTVEIDHGRGFKTRYAHLPRHRRRSRASASPSASGSAAWAPPAAPRACTCTTKCG